MSDSGGSARYLKRSRRKIRGMRVVSDIRDGRRWKRRG